MDNIQLPQYRLPSRHRVKRLTPKPLSRGSNSPQRPDVFKIQSQPKNINTKEFIESHINSKRKSIDPNLIVLSPYSQKRATNKYKQKIEEMTTILDETLIKCQHDYDFNEVLKLQQIMEKESQKSNLQTEGSNQNLDEIWRDEDNGSTPGVSAVTIEKKKNLINEEPVLNNLNLRNILLNPSLTNKADYLSKLLMDNEKLLAMKKVQEGINSNDTKFRRKDLQITSVRTRERDSLTNPFVIGSMGQTEELSENLVTLRSKIDIESTQRVNPKKLQLDLKLITSNHLIVIDDNKKQNQSQSQISHSFRDDEYVLRSKRKKNSESNIAASPYGIDSRTLAGIENEIMMENQISPTISINKVEESFKIRPIVQQTRAKTPIAGNSIFDKLNDQNFVKFFEELRSPTPIRTLDLGNLYKNQCKIAKQAYSNKIDEVIKNLVKKEKPASKKYEIPTPILKSSPRLKERFQLPTKIPELNSPNQSQGLKLKPFIEVSITNNKYSNLTSTTPQADTTMNSKRHEISLEEPSIQYPLTKKLTPNIGEIFNEVQQQDSVFSADASEPQSYEKISEKIQMKQNAIEKIKEKLKALNEYRYGSVIEEIDISKYMREIQTQSRNINIEIKSNQNSPSRMGQSLQLEKSHYEGCTPKVESRHPIKKLQVEQKLRQWKENQIKMRRNTTLMPALQFAPVEVSNLILNKTRYKIHKDKDKQPNLDATSKESIIPRPIPIIDRIIIQVDDTNDCTSDQNDQNTMANIQSNEGFPVKKIPLNQQPISKDSLPPMSPIQSKQNQKIVQLSLKTEPKITEVFSNKTSIRSEPKTQNWNGIIKQQNQQLMNFKRQKTLRMQRIQQNKMQTIEKLVGKSMPKCYSPMSSFQQRRPSMEITSRVSSKKKMEQERLKNIVNQYMYQMRILMNQKNQLQNLVGYIDSQKSIKNLNYSLKTNNRPNTQEINRKFYNQDLDITPRGRQCVPSKHYKRQQFKKTTVFDEQREFSIKGRNLQKPQKTQKSFATQTQQTRLLPTHMIKRMTNAMDQETLRGNEIMLQTDGEGSINH